MKFALLVVVLCAVVGCGASSATPDATQADFSKRPPPAGWHGPSGAPGGATPPAAPGK